MSAVSITFIGGEDDGNVGFTTMGPPGKTEVRFPLNQAVVLDPDKAKNGPEKATMEQIIAKARTNRFFKVEDRDSEAAAAKAKAKAEAEAKEAADAKAKTDAEAEARNRATKK